jgi:nucleoside 2-deoxyribosyltransferase
VKIYFAGSIAGGRKYLETYKKIVDYLQSQGHEVPTEHIVHPQVLTLENKLTPQEIYNRDIQWIEECKALIAEVSNPSLGVGYEIGYALNIDKPVLCLYQEGIFLSRMILGNTSTKLQVKQYQDVSQCKRLIDAFLLQGSSG